MKTFTKWVIICSLVLSNACSSTEIESTIQTAIVDAEATFATYTALMEACPACAGNPFSHGAIGAVASIVGADASGAFGRQQSETNTHGKTQNISLPEGERLSNNPYEEFGMKHNLALNYINSKVDFDTYQTKMKTYDKLEWVNTIKVICPEKTIGEIEEIFNFAKEQNVVGLFDYSKYQTVKTIDDFNTHLQKSSLSSSLKTKLHGIFVEIERISRAENVADLTIAFINSEIQKMLKPKGGYTSEESRVLVLLSTYKHSLFYWKK